jgi:ubiquinone/menaquinone biosynthesis C-methylase UbiE
MKSLIKQLCPPFIWNTLLSLKTTSFKVKSTNILIKKDNQIQSGDKQDLDLYWDAKYALVLEEWGKDNVWNEIQLILASCKGKVLDIACGTGITISLLKKYPDIELFGFDISDLLISKAIEKNIPKENLQVCDATKTDYKDNEFNYSYSIGSLEHFTLDGIDKFISESARYTKTASFHMIPVSRSGVNEGWMKTQQSFFNNSEEWWDQKFKKHYANVYCVSSKWNDDKSYGKWFLCIK